MPLLWSAITWFAALAWLSMCGGPVSALLEQTPAYIAFAVTLSLAGAVVRWLNPGRWTLRLRRSP